MNRFLRTCVQVPAVLVVLGSMHAIASGSSPGSGLTAQAPKDDVKVASADTQAMDYARDHALTPMSDDEMNDVTGQSLLVADFFNGADFGGDPDLDFRRMVLDADVEFNMNIDHMQLGCGGFNQQLAGASEACDVDIEYLGLMGTGGGQPGAEGAPSSPGGTTNDFLLRRPYLEFVLKNNNDPTTREIVGLKVGAQQANGYMNIGRFRDTAYCNDNPGDITCHRGINRLSGWLQASLSGEAYGCAVLFGGCEPADNKEDQELLADFETTREVYGTRMQRVFFGGVPMTSRALIEGLEIQADINASLRYVHGTQIDADENSSSDFFISFQREQVQYPNFSKDTASVPTNTGWWMNIPNASMEGLKSYDKSVNAGSIAGVYYADIDFGQRPADNCFGGLDFC